MVHHISSIRAFIGAKDFTISKSFYLDLGFEEVHSSDDLSYFQLEQYGFYLQDYHQKEWIENSMMFLEVDDIDRYYQWLIGLDLPNKYHSVKISEVKVEFWGKVCFLHDPSGVLWQIGEFTPL